MTLKFWTQIIFAFMVIPAMAQYNPEAKEHLAKAANNVKSSTGIEAKFEVTLENKQEDMAETSEGTVWLKGEKFKLSIMGFDSYFDGETMWTHMVEEGEVNITTPDPEDEEGLTPTNIFSLYEKGFNFKIVEESSEQISIDMFPENREKPFSKINVVVNKTTNQFVSVTSIGKDGINNTIKIIAFKKDLNLEDSMFAFDASKYPDVEIVDMR